jgi:hypothetical protein
LLELVKLPSSILLPLQNSVHTSGNWAFSCKLVCSIDAHFPDCQQLQFHLSLNLPTFLFWQVLLEITSLLERHQIQLPGVVPRWNNFFLKKYWRTGWKVAREAAREYTRNWRIYASEKSYYLLIWKMWWDAQPRWLLEPWMMTSLSILCISSSDLFWYMGGGGDARRIAP